MTSRLLPDGFREGVDTITVSMPDYTPEGWKRLRAIADDAPLASFAELQARTARMLNEFKSSGAAVRIIVMDVAAVDEMADWCRHEGYLLDSEGRCVFGAYKACQLDDQAEVLH